MEAFAVLLRQDHDNYDGDGEDDGEGGDDFAYLSIAFLVPTRVHGEGSGCPFASVATALERPSVLEWFCGCYCCFKPCPCSGAGGDRDASSPDVPQGG